MGQVREFCEAITGKWVQVKNENMDAINAGSGFDSPLYYHSWVDERGSPDSRLVKLSAF